MLFSKKVDGDVLASVKEYNDTHFKTKSTPMWTERFKAFQQVFTSESVDIA